MFGKAFPDLMEGEHIVYQGRSHWFAWGQYPVWLGIIVSSIYAVIFFTDSTTIGYIVLAAIAAGAIYAIADVIGAVIQTILEILFATIASIIGRETVVVTNMRIFNKVGFRKVKEIKLSSIKEIKTKKGLLGNLIGYRHIVITSEDDDKIALDFLPQKALASIPNLAEGN